MTMSLAEKERSQGLKLTRRGGLDEPERVWRRAEIKFRDHDVLMARGIVTPSSTPPREASARGRALVRLLETRG